MKTTKNQTSQFLDDMNRNILLSISGTIIVILLGVNGYFLKNMAETVVSLQATVNDLKTILEVHKESQKASVTLLSDHTDLLESLSNRVHSLETDFEVHKVNPNAHHNN